MKKILLYITTFLLVACGNNAKVEGHHHDHHDHGEPGTVVELNSEQMGIANIKLGSLTTFVFDKGIKCTGKLELPPQNKASVSAVIGGRIAEVNVIEGAMVKKGEVLATLQHPDIITYQEDFLNAYITYGQAEKDFERKKMLIQDSVISLLKFEETEVFYKNSKAKYNALKAKLSLLGINEQNVRDGKITKSLAILAPISGSVKQISANIGKHVTPADYLFEIVDNDHIHIDLQVYEQDINKVRVGQKVQFSLTGDDRTIYNASVFAIGQAFDNDTKAIRVHAEINGEVTTMYPGMFVNATIHSEINKSRCLPEEAVLFDGIQNYVFLKDSEHEGNTVFKKIDVVIGSKEQNRIEIVPSEAIATSDQIVVQGAFYVDAEMKKGEAGHHH